MEEGVYALYLPETGEDGKTCYGYPRYAVYIHHKKEDVGISIRVEKVKGTYIPIMGLPNCCFEKPLPEVTLEDIETIHETGGIKLARIGGLENLASVFDKILE